MPLHVLSLSPPSLLFKLGLATFFQLIVPPHSLCLFTNIQMDRSTTDVEAAPGQNETARVGVQVVPIQKRPLAPLFWSRMTSLFFAFAFLVIAGSLGAFFCLYILLIELGLRFFFLPRLCRLREVSQRRKSTRRRTSLRNSRHHKHRKFVSSSTPAI